MGADLLILDLVGFFNGLEGGLCACLDGAKYGLDILDMSSVMSMALSDLLSSGYSIVSPLVYFFSLSSMSEISLTGMVSSDLSSNVMTTK